MRSLLLACVALTATLTSAFAPSVAEACGGNDQNLGPQVFAVNTHSVIVEGTPGWERRWFVTLGSAPTTDAKWRQLAPRTFDPTKIANENTSVASTTMTLVGPSGTRIISSQRHALLSSTWDYDGVFAVLEVAAGAESQFEIALAGVQPDAKWLVVTHTEARAGTKAWLKTQGMNALSVYDSTVEGTSIQVVTAHQDGHKVTSFVRIGNRSLGRYTGSTIGALELGGKRYVLFETNGLITPVAV